MRSLALAAATTFAAFTGAPPAAAQYWLKAPRVYDEWQGEVRLAGDLDADGDVDLIRFEGYSISGYWSGFTVLRNDGAGEFTPGSTQPLTPREGGTHVLLADVNGDGRADVLVTTLSTHPTLGAGLLFFAGLPNAAFAAPLHLPLGGNVIRLDKGHGNGDGIEDIAVVHYELAANAWHLRWILGNASNQFSIVPGKLTSAPVWIGGLAVLDLSNDGVDDFAITGDARIQTYITSGAAPLTAGPAYPVVEDFDTTLCVTDIDTDGDRDLLGWSTTGYTTALLHRIQNLGGGSFAQLAVQTLPGTRSGNMYPADWDGDGVIEIFFREWGSTSPTYRIYDNNGTGTFVQRFAGYMSFTTDSGGVGVFDLNRDGHADFADNQAIYFGDGTFRDPFASQGASIHGVRDWEDDGDLDLPQYQGQLWVNDGRGQFVQRNSTWPPNQPAGFFYGNEVIVADFDGNGLHEHLVPYFFQQFPRNYVFVEMRLLRDTGTGTIVDAGAATALTQQIPDQPVATDADGDGDLDLASTSGLWLNNGSTFFTRAPAVDFQYYYPNAKGDVDGDGDEDILGRYFGGTQSIALLRRTTPGAYHVEVLYPPTTQSILGRASILADLDDDGDLDIAVDRGPYASELTFFKNSGGAFTQDAVVGFQTPSGQGVGSVTTFDVDGDGKTDLALGTTDRVHVMRRIGPGFAYDAMRAYATGPALPRTGGDIDNDGDFDLIGNLVLRNPRFDGPDVGFNRQYGAPLAGSSGRQPVIGSTGPRRVGHAPVLRLRGGLGGAPAALKLGLSETYIPNYAGIPGLTLYTSPLVIFSPLFLSGAPGVAGAGEFDLSVLLTPEFGGISLFAQALILDPGAPHGISATNGIELYTGH